MDALSTYRGKRDFRRTTEPEGAKPGAARRQRIAKRATSGAYVIQKHAARALHYDVRLELDGVFKSWAVPKGPGLVPGEKHLAVRVEDHPLEYGDFEGVIPKGEYGGGTVMLWDRGRWHHKDGDLESGKLEFILDGDKLKGIWLLVKMGGARNADSKNWLLIKRRDGLPTGEPSDLSVATGRSMKEIARARDRTWTRDGETKSELPDAEAKVPSAARLKGSVRRKMPAVLAPQLATLVDTPPAQATWIHEIKFDGYRIGAHISGGDVRLFSRNGKDWTRRFPEIARTLAALPVRSAYCDGEVVAITSNGATSFRHLQEALSTERTDALVYQVFDLMHLDGYDLTGVVQAERKRALADVLAAAGFRGDGRVRYTDHIEGSGEEFYQASCTLGLEGIVSKNAEAPYREGRTRSWLKTKCSQHDELVVGGYTDPTGTRIGFGALLLGMFDEHGKLTYVGKVGTGFDTRQLQELTSKLRAITVAKSPFATTLPMKGVHWTRPILVAEVEFTERTREGMLRHPSFRGLREDKGAKEVRTVDIAKSTNKPAPGKPRGRPKSANERPKGRVDRADDGEDSFAGVKLTHPERVLWPELGTTKADLARYYQEVESWLLPLLRRRPLALLRCPEGRTKACFFQKHPGESTSESIPRIPIREKDSVESYMYIETITDVVRLVQMGVLELHVWGSRVDDLERPDLIVFDLDPGPRVSWDQVIGAAQTVREILADLKFASFARVTGGKGLHVVVPLKPSADWDTVKAFSLAIAQLIERDSPERFTTNMAKSKREGRIFIDYLRNGRGATAIASYSTRAREGAPVAMPVRWEELSAAMTPDRYNIGSAPRRMKSLRKDPWPDFDDARRPLGKEIRRVLDAQPVKAETKRTKPKARAKTATPRRTTKRTTRK